MQELVDHSLVQINLYSFWRCTRCSQESKMGTIRQNLPPTRENTLSRLAKLASLRQRLLHFYRAIPNKLPMPKKIRLATTEMVAESVLLAQ